MRRALVVALFVAAIATPCVSLVPSPPVSLPLPLNTLARGGRLWLFGGLDAVPTTTPGNPAGRSILLEGGATKLRASSGADGVQGRRALLKILAGGALAAAAGPGKAALAASDVFGDPVFVVPVEKKLPPPQDPYQQLEPFGESFRGKKGPNLQLPSELSQDDAVPAAMSKLDQRRIDEANKKVDYFENLSAMGIGGSLLWGTALYYGVWFDINVHTNAIQIASGDEGDVRPSDWLKLRLGGLMGMQQDTWDDAWRPPASIQAFTMALFLSLGVVTDRLIEVGLGDSFALMSAVTAAIWAGVYELGRTQQKGYRLTREEQEELDELQIDFTDFAEERLVVKPSARMHISEFTGAFRSQYGKYRTSEMISDAKVEALFKMYARKATGQKGKAGFYKGIGISAQMNAFGRSNSTFRREKEAEKFRESAKGQAEKAAAKSVSLAEKSKGGKEENADIKMKAGEASLVGDGQDEW